MENAEKQILSTVVYFDCFDHALSLEDLFKFLVSLKHLDLPSRSISFAEISELLKKDNLKKYIDTKDGFYFLQGRESLVAIRKEREKISALHFKILNKYLRLFSTVPFVRGVALSGSLAIKNIREDSDWDLLFLVQKGRLYTATFGVSLLAALFFRKWQKFGFKNIFCLNHFVVSDDKEMSARSIYEAAEFLKMKPVFDEGNHFKNFIQCNKQWMEGYFFHIDAKLEKKEIENTGRILWLKNMTEKLLQGRAGDFLEKIFRKIIVSRIEKNKKKLSGLGRIVLDGKQIEYHPRSPQKEIIEGHNATMKALGFEDLAKEKDSGLYWIG
ncbi:MAG: hypothetical protein UT37_C0005G0016 [Parcubacteria group bacterium GW2011_GWA2_39_18]|nr:MAG: hypothetical protein UT37_C0005G0016 [Parcubacteria group bacterium GW2011_GWA2_39_18]